MFQSVFPYKYVAVCLVDGSQHRGFYTETGAYRWLRKQSFYVQFVVEIQRVLTPYQALMVELEKNTKELAEVEERIQELLRDDEEYDERCGKEFCLYCYGSQEEYEASIGLFQEELPFEEEPVFIRNTDYWAQPAQNILRKRDLVDGVKIGDEWYQLTPETVAELGEFVPVKKIVSHDIDEDGHCAACDAEIETGGAEALVRLRKILLGD